MNLTDLQVLALDCQATGANPEKGHLLEIGWVETCAAATTGPKALPVRSYLAALPPEGEISPAVQRVTGICKETLAKALSPADIWQKVAKAARRIAADDQMAACPTVIHYARFEAPFLRNLYADNDRREAFPLRIICTHEIAKRLLPGLPRRGLRAVAGYYGHSVPPSRRSADHAVATAVIWQNLVQQLKMQYNIQRLDQLTEWMSRTIPQSRTGRVYPMKPEIRLSLPDTPGIYRMRRSNGDLLYIGKATSLKHRVNSYFRQKGSQAEHTLEMLSQAVHLDVTRTGSALEAALLESDEIKRHSPPYNIALQKGQRQLAFCSKDLKKRAAKPDKIHRIGPLPEGNITAAMTAFAVWNENSRRSSEDAFFKIGYDILGVPQTFAPEANCLTEGLALFHRNHLTRAKHLSPLQIITGLGRELWQARLAALETAQSEAARETAEEAPVDPKLEADDSPNWTPETVARGIEKFTMRSALLIRRSRWLCLLSESTLAWEARNGKDRRKIVLRLENGAVCHREQMPLTKKAPNPAGHIKRMAKRQKIFDLTTYERLRVVTTELRRLMAEGRKIEIHLSPNAILSQRQLAGILPWV
jgi:DNA polymerase-3 subunit epsilon